MAVKFLIDACSGAGVDSTLLCTDHNAVCLYIVHDLSMVHESRREHIDTCAFLGASIEIHVDL
jgi:hypothetical protein